MGDRIGDCIFLSQRLNGKLFAILKACFWTAILVGKKHVKNSTVSRVEIM